MFVLAAKPASTERRATDFKLPNGMDVVVIPDHRAPIGFTPQVRWSPEASGGSRRLSKAERSQVEPAKLRFAT